MTDDNRGGVPPTGHSDTSRGGGTPTPAGAGGGLFETGPANVQLLYVLYLLGFVLGGLSNLVAVVFAYVYKDGAEAWLKTHYHYQIRTFWLTLLYAVVSALLALVVIGFFLAVLTAVWLILRCVKGLNKLQKAEPIDNVATWWV